MSRPKKTLDKILQGRSDANIAFRDLCSMLEHYGFECRTKGSHHIYSHDEVEDIINIQAENGKAKSNQVKQVRDLMILYGIALRIFLEERDDENI